ncbi:MAG: Asp-tRNA(Asn)/Glu-tRNA(Gln) amidotransferase subunit GatC [Chlamydiales bacterium]|nr:Asp-tRNA(Asn)/Glu-tRNA(Gln) amidotransferase subunit GatC [Chlamydiales bacterium]
MSEFTEKTLSSLTRLSRIECSQEEREGLFKDLTNILQYIDMLGEVNTENVPPCNHVLEDICNVMREDVVEQTLTRELFLSVAPSSVGGMIKVPTVIKRS